MNLRNLLAVLLCLSIMAANLFAGPPTAVRDRDVIRTNSIRDIRTTPPRPLPGLEQSNALGSRGFLPIPRPSCTSAVEPGSEQESVLQRLLDEVFLRGSGFPTVLPARRLPQIAAPITAPTSKTPSIIGKIFGGKSAASYRAKVSFGGQEITITKGALKRTIAKIQTDDIVYPYTALFTEGGRDFVAVPSFHHDQITIYDIETKQSVLKIPMPSRIDLPLLTRQRNGRTEIVATSSKGRVYFIDPATGKTRLTIDTGDSILSGPAQFSKDQHDYVVVGLTGASQVYDSETGARLTTFMNTGGNPLILFEKDGTVVGVGQ